MKRLILHVGRHKTGTSTLQATLAESRDALTRQGVLYPALPRLKEGAGSGGDAHIAHHGLARVLDARNGFQGMLPAMVASIRDQARAAPGLDTLLLSSEAFPRIQNPALLRAFIGAFGTPEVEVICYVREVLDYAVSAWRQRIQAQPRFITFRDYCGRLRSMESNLAMWESLGRLRLDWYDSALARHGDIVADFLAATGLALDEDDSASARRNASIGGNLLYLRLRAIHADLPFLAYAPMGRLAQDDPAFRRPFHIPDDLAEDLRAGSGYSAPLERRLGPPPVLRSWADQAPLPDADRLEADIETIRAAYRPRQARADLDWLDELAPEAGFSYL